MVTSTAPQVWFMVGIARENVLQTIIDKRKDGNLLSVTCIWLHLHVCWDLMGINEDFVGC